MEKTEIPQAGREGDIEVTPAMISAGDEAFALFDQYDPVEWILPAIYRAMERARRKS